MPCRGSKAYASKIHIADKIQSRDISEDPLSKI